MILTLTAIIPLQNINPSVIIKKEDVFCNMTNKYTIISQAGKHLWLGELGSELTAYYRAGKVKVKIITILHVSTLSCHPQGA